MVVDTDEHVDEAAQQQEHAQREEQDTPGAQAPALVPTPEGAAAAGPAVGPGVFPAPAGAVRDQASLVVVVAAHHGVVPLGLGVLALRLVRVRVVGVARQPGAAPVVHRRHTRWALVTLVIVRVLHPIPGSISTGHFVPTYWRLFPGLAPLPAMCRAPYGRIKPCVVLANHGVSLPGPVRTARAPVFLERRALNAL